LATRRSECRRVIWASFTLAKPPRSGLPELGIF
jgi:hypothetical protein